MANTKHTVFESGEDGKYTVMRCGHCREVLRFDPDTDHECREPVLLTVKTDSTSGHLRYSDDYSHALTMHLEWDKESRIEADAFLNSIAARWNAFEPGGEVERLRNALKNLLHFQTELGEPQPRRGMHTEEQGLTGAMADARAALEGK